MDYNSPNWIAFYHRFGEEVSMPFHFDGSPTLSNVISKIRKHPQLIDFVLPYVPPGMSIEAKEEAFLFVNGITGVVYTPLIGGEEQCKRK